MLTAAVDCKGLSGPALEERVDILFVDDDPLLREFASVNLAAGGRVAVAEDGVEALSSIRLRRADIVILDLQMPRIDGFAVLHALRSDEATRRLPVIVITARDDVASIDRAFSEGASGFLVKPINWRLLAHQIRYVRRAAQTEFELAEALREAAAASEAKSKFLATMSHELRTPLNAIIGFSDILDRQMFGEIGDLRYLEYIRAIGSSGSQLLSLVSDILEISRASVGKVVLSEEDFPAGDVIDEAMQSVASQAKAAGVTVSADGATGDLCLRADRRRICRVLTSLLGNAVKFTPSGGSVSLRAATQRDGLAIAISDTGIGIAAEDIPRALEHFGQIESHLSRKHGGAGLGLPLAKQLMEQHGGTLAIESAVNVGTTVTVRFPRERIVQPTMTA